MKRVFAVVLIAFLSVCMCFAGGMFLTGCADTASVVSPIDSVSDPENSDGGGVFPRRN